MTIGELIEKLKEYPPTAKVYRFGYNPGVFFNVEVSQVTPVYAQDAVRIE